MTRLSCVLLTVLAMMLAMVVASAGCASDRQQQVLIEEVGGAASVGGARNDVYWRRADLQTRSDLSAETREELLAECDAIDAQASALERAIDASAGNASQWQARARALDARVDAFLASYPAAPDARATIR